VVASLRALISAANRLGLADRELGGVRPQRAA
jgi:hypothetical protein